MWLRTTRLAVVLLGLVTLASVRAGAAPTLLFNPDDGRIFYAEQLDDQWHPASLTKIMTAYLAFEALRGGKVSPDTKLTVSETAHAQPPSKIGLPVGAELGFELGLRALIVKSANDVAIMLAEGLAGSEEAFVARMNAKARELGMTRTHFVNPSGLPAQEQVTTARDLARLSIAVMKDFPEYAYYWSMSRMQIGKIKLASHNSLLRNFEGANGLKTGFICDSGYNIIASAQRGDLRLMAIVLGGTTAADRTDRTATLLSHGFETYSWKRAFATANVRTSAVAPVAKEVRSIRSTVKVTTCGWRRQRVKRVMKVSEKAREAGAKTAKASSKPKGKQEAAKPPAKSADRPAGMLPAEGKVVAKKQAPVPDIGAKAAKVRDGAP